MPTRTSTKKLTKKTAPKKAIAVKKAAKKAAPLKKTAKTRARVPGRRKKDVNKLVGRYATDFIVEKNETGPSSPMMAGAALANGEDNPALLRLKALQARDVADTLPSVGAAAPVNNMMANWTPMGPLAVTNGQTYGGARVLISGRVTDVELHPTDPNIIYIGTSRGGVWRTNDGGQQWSALSDNEASLAIGSLAIARSNPDILYAGTGEGNVQFYSTAFPLDSAPGVYLGVGILRSSDGGASWSLQATSLLANHSFYRIMVDRNNADRVFAATSRGLCRTLNGGALWTNITGGLPAITSTVIACTDVLIDESDASGNTVYAAFWRDGIYKSVNALAATPTWTKLTTGLPAGASVSRISLAQSPSNPSKKYAVIANTADTLLGVYVTNNAASTTWALATNSATIELYGAFTQDIAVDPVTPDIIYISGVELYKAVRNTTTGVWTATNIGGNIHPDSHAIAVSTADHNVIYSGNDGGIYKSSNAGLTWDDTINEGLCLLQYEAIDNHPTSDGIILGGCQDNGTQQYRNSPVHYHAADGDGGYCLISKTAPNKVIHSYYGVSFERSPNGGKFGSWVNASTGINGSGLFYPPSAISPSSERMAVGTNLLNIDDTMGAGSWPGTGVSLPGITGNVSAISFTSNTQIYAATTSGQVYRLDLSGTTWTVRTLHAAPLPTGQWIWDITTVPGSPNQVIIAFSGFGLSAHVWRGTVPATGTATWTSISGGLPDVPMYALAMESATEFYVGTDIGVFRTTNAGSSWNNFSQGLPNTAIYDLRYQPGLNLLRAATHGRGLWEVRTDLNVQPTTDIFVRDHLMHTGRYNSAAAATAAFEDPLRFVSLNDSLFWWQCADIKTDAPPGFQYPPAAVDYLVFETSLQHENPEKGNQNRVYVQVHNRGPVIATNVTVKIMVASAAAGLPDLPSNFWSTWPNSTGDANWTAIGSPQVIPVLHPLRPEVINWPWTPANTADTHTCMLVVVDSPSDPIPAANKVFNIAQLVTNEKRIGLKNLHLVNVIAGIVAVPFQFFAAKGIKKPYRIEIGSAKLNAVTYGIILPKDFSKKLKTEGPLKGVKAAKLTATDLTRLKEQFLGKELRDERYYNDFLQNYDLQNVLSIDKNEKGFQFNAVLNAKEPLRAFVVFKATENAVGMIGSFNIMQYDSNGKLSGGSTFVVRRKK